MTKKYKLDSIDLKILYILAKDGRISNIDLSQKVGISPSPCLRRVKILQDKGIIKNFYADIDYSFLGYDVIVFASINIEVQSEKDKSTFEKQLSQIKEVLEIYELSSNKDFLVKIIAKDYMDYKQIINTKLAKLPFIKNIRTTKISKIIKSTTFFEEN